MARKAKDLTAFSVARLDKPGMHFVGEVPGLALQVLPTGGRTWILRIVIGEVVAVYIDDSFIEDGLVMTGKMRPLARLGYMDFSVVTPENMFTLNRPNASADGLTASVQPGAWDGVYR